MVKTEIKVERKALYVDGTTVKVGAKGTPVDAGEFFGVFTSRGQRKRLRKQLTRAGFVDASARPTIFPSE